MRRNELNARLRTEEINRTEVELPEPDKLTATHVELGMDVKNSVFPSASIFPRENVQFFKTSSLFFMGHVAFLNSDSESLSLSRF
jgi:hypothetical protein